MHHMTISRAARAAGVGVETIRFYERKGLINQPPKPMSGGYRIYPAKTIERIRSIRQAQEMGFSLRETDELLSLRANPLSDCAHVRAQAEAKLAEVNRKIARLNRICAGLERVIAACPGEGALEACSIMEALECPEVPPLH